MRIRLLKLSAVFPNSKVGDEVEAEKATARNQVRMGYAELADEADRGELLRARDLNPGPEAPRTMRVQILVESPALLAKVGEIVEVETPTAKNLVREGKAEFVADGVEAETASVEPPAKRGPGRPRKVKPDAGPAPDNGPGD